MVHSFSIAAWLLITLALLSLLILQVKQSKDFRSFQEQHDNFGNWVKRMGLKAEEIAVKKEDMKNASLTAVEEILVLVVDQVGNGNFKTINEAIASIPGGSSTRYVVSVKPGIYKEKVSIPASKGPITIQGSGNTVTTITYNMDAKTAGGTLKSASVSVLADCFVAKDIAFENSSPSPPAGAEGRQAVAFMISGDKAAFYRVAFLGFQDTLYDRNGRHYFKDCYIQGTVDYIFGNGLSYYESCTLMTLNTTFGSLLAQKRMAASEDTGYSFVNCWVGGEGYDYLSRAWGPYSRVVFIKTYFGSNIRPEGWSDWGDSSRDETVFYGEYECYGPGSNTQGREPWSLQLTEKQVQPFLTVDWIQGSSWIPTGRQ